MDSALSTLGFVIFGLTFCIYAFLVESQLEIGSSAIVSLRQSPRPLPPTRPSPSPSSLPSAHLPPQARPPQHPPRSPHPPRQSPHPPRQPLHPTHLPQPPPLLQPSRQMAIGKKIGLLFVGIAGIMQIGVVGFLVYKRKQLLKMKDIFENGS